MTTTVAAEHPSCGECKFWAQTEHGSESGSCHANPPTASNFWPFTRFTDWCGRHAKIPAPPKAKTE